MADRTQSAQPIPAGVDAEKLEEAVLALLYSNSFDEKAGGKRA